jgi:hypothetical protein
MYGLPNVTNADLNSYTFPDLADVVSGLDGYITSLKGVNPNWPVISKTLRFGKDVTQPGMVLVLGNPQASGNQINCRVMNNLLPGVSYKTIHQGYTGPDEFVWTNQEKARQFFLSLSALAVMPENYNDAGNPPATQTPDGVVLVNAHSRCAPGLLVHEIFHAYGCPAGFIGEGVTDWFALDFMEYWRKPYDGNPAYAYHVAVMGRLIAMAGKERVARLAFSQRDAWGARTGKITVKSSDGTKDLQKTVSYGGMDTQTGVVCNYATSAQYQTMVDAEWSPEKIASTVPLPASENQETRVGLPGALRLLADMLIALMPDVQRPTTQAQQPTSVVGLRGGGVTRGARGT